MPSRTLTLLIAVALTVASARLLVAAAPAESELSKALAEAANHQSGQNIEPLRKLEQLVRDSAAKPALRAELEAGLIKLLAPTATFEARRFACQQLMAIGTEASLPALAGLLKNEETAGIACLALGGQGSPKAAEILRGELVSARGPTGLQIIVALGNRRDAESVKPLAAFARDSNHVVAEAAILAVSKIGTPEARQVVAALRKDPPPNQARALTEAAMRAAEQLAAGGDRKAAAALYAELLQPSAPVQVRRGALAALLPLDEDGGQQRVLDTLRGKDASLAPVAIARVGSLKGEGVSRQFAAILPGLPPGPRMWMIEALASRGDAAALAAIRAEVAAADAGVRRAAVRAVGRLDDASAVGLLLGALAKASGEEVHDVELALSNLRGGAATDAALIAVLPQAPGGAKVSLLLVFARRDARTAVPSILAEAGGSETVTVRVAFQSLGRLAAAEDLPAVLEKLAGLKAADARPEAESAAARTMARIGEVARRSEAVRAALAKSADGETRGSLLRLLPKAPDAAALDALVAAVKDTEPRTRDAAVRALATWPDAAGWNALLAVFNRPENAAHRALALRAMVRLAGDLNAKPDAALVERYRQLLARSLSDDERKLVLGALAGAAHPDALAPALALVSEPGVRAEAEVAVRKIAESVKAQHPQAAQAALERLKQAKP